MFDTIITKENIGELDKIYSLYCAGRENHGHMYLHVGSYFAYTVL